MRHRYSDSVRSSGGARKEIRRDGQRVRDDLQQLLRLRAELVLLGSAREPARVDGARGQPDSKRPTAFTSVNRYFNSNTWGR